VTITETNGTSHTFNVKNGTDGKDGQDGQDGADGVSLGEIALVQTTGNSEESVMSQKAVTDYGRKVTAEDLNGTSEWIRAKLTEEGWEFGKYVASNGNLANNTSYCASAFIPISDIKGHSITIRYMYNAWTTSCFCFYNSSKTFISGLYYTVNANNARTVTIGISATWDDVAYIRMTCNPNRLDECYILDNTTGEYLFKGDEYLISLCDGNIGYDALENSIIAQVLGDSTVKVMSQKAVSEAIEAEPLRKMKFNNYAVFGSASDMTCTSVDTYDIDELKVITSLRICDGFNSNGYSCYNSNLKHILGIVSATNPSGDYLSIYCEGYNMYLWFKKNGTNVLKYSLGNSSGRKILKTFARIDLYGKTVSFYSKCSDNTYLTILENYDISDLDLSNLQKVKIVTSVGTSHNERTLFNHVQINNYIIDPTEELDTVVNFGEYSAKKSHEIQTKPVTPSSFMFTNEGAAEGINIVLNDPYHKIVEVDRDTVERVYNVGFSTTWTAPYTSYAYEIFKVKFTNVTSNLLMRGWSENGGSNYIIDPETYEYTKIPMNTTTGTVLEYPIVEGKTYFIIYALGTGYSTRYNHYFGGHFTMEITEPTLYCVGSMNLCGEYYDGQYFCGFIPFKSAVKFVPDIFGQFYNTCNLPSLKGRFRLNVYGNVQVCDGSVWKQINNS